MKGIILAGGEGKRLQPLGLGVPKPLVTVRDRPLMNYNLGLFAKYGVNDVKVVIRPQDQDVYAAWLAKSSGAFPKTKIELIAEPEPMGTFGYIFHELRSWMGNEDVFVTNGDDIKDIDLKKMLAFHRVEKAPLTLALMKMEKPDDYGAVLVSANRIERFLEKQVGMPAGLVSAGMYLVSSPAIEHFERETSKKGRFLMFERDLFPVLARANQLGAFVCEGTFFDCGTPERLERAIREI